MKLTRHGHLRQNAFEICKVLHLHKLQTAVNLFLPVRPFKCDCSELFSCGNKNELNEVVFFSSLAFPWQNPFSKDCGNHKLSQLKCSVFFVEMFEAVVDAAIQTIVIMFSHGNEQFVPSVTAKIERRDNWSFTPFFSSNYANARHSKCNYKLTESLV